MPADKLSKPLEFLALKALSGVVLTRDASPGSIGYLAPLLGGEIDRNQGANSSKKEKIKRVEFLFINLGK